MLKPTAIFCLLEVSLLPLAPFAGSLDVVCCHQGGKLSRLWSWRTRQHWPCWGQRKNLSKCPILISRCFL